MNTVKGPTGHAVVMLQPRGINSIIIVQGANISWPRLEDGIGRLTSTVQQLIRRAGAILLQREVPDSVNLEAAKVQIFVFQQHAIIGLLNSPLKFDFYS